ncbi:MAG: LysR substrate-binding domain-containing protein [Cellulosilyticaceae bacterium]
MNIRKLEVFYATAISLNMTKVAKMYYISQPSVSQTIKEIEEEVGAVLFDRIGKKLYLTGEGELYLHYVRRMLNLYKEANDVLGELGGKNKGRIRLGASTTIGVYVLPTLLKIFKEAYKDIEVLPTIENTTQIEEMLLENKIDLALIEGEVVSEELIKVPLWKDEILLIDQRGNYGEAEVVIDPVILENQKLIIREKGSGTRELMEKYMEDHGITYDVLMELSENEAIKRSVEAGLGMGCISILCAKNEEDRKKLTLCRLNTGKIERDLYLVYHKDKFMNQAMKAFMKELYKQ